MLTADVLPHLFKAHVTKCRDCGDTGESVSYCKRPSLNVDGIVTTHLGTFNDNGATFQRWQAPMCSSRWRDRVGQARNGHSSQGRRQRSHSRGGARHLRYSGASGLFKRYTGEQGQHVNHGIIVCIDNSSQRSKQSQQASSQSVQPKHAPTETPGMRYGTTTVPP